jgi:hypothetical protein
LGVVVFLAGDSFFAAVFLGVVVFLAASFSTTVSSTDETFFLTVFFAGAFAGGFAGAFFGRPFCGESFFVVVVLAFVVPDLVLLLDGGAIEGLPFAFDFFISTFGLLSIC